MKCVIVNDGDIYGYIFAHALLKNNIDVEFVKLPDSEKVVNENILLNHSLRYLKKYGLFDINNISNISGTFAANQKLVNFFQSNDYTFLNYDLPEFLNSNSVVRYMKNKGSAFDVEHMFNKNLLSDGNLVDDRRLDEYHLVIDFSKFKNIDTLKAYNNFVYKEASDIKDIVKTQSDGQLFFIDNTSSNLLTNAEFEKTQARIPYRYEKTITNHHKYYEEEILNFEKIEFFGKEIKETVTSFTDSIENSYVKFDGLENCINTHVYQNSIFNLGTAFCKYNFSFHLDQILHFYIFDKILTFIVNRNKNFSYLNSVREHSFKIFNNIDTFLHRIFLYAGKTNDINIVGNIDLLPKTNINFLETKYYDVNCDLFLNTIEKQVFEFVIQSKIKKQAQDFLFPNQYAYLIKYQYSQQIPSKKELLYV